MAHIDMGAVVAQIATSFKDQIARQFTRKALADSIASVLTDNPQPRRGARVKLSGRWPDGKVRLP